jgi:methionyl-tRNA formyltransferase
VQRAVIAGDELSGAAVFQLVRELDAGGVFGQISEPIGAHTTSGQLLETLSQSGAELLVRVVAALADGTAEAVEQTGDVTLAPKLTIDDARVDWTQPADVVYNRVRGVTPEPGAFTTVDGARFKLLEVAPVYDGLALPAGMICERDKKVLVGTGSEPLELRSVQPAGKTVMTASDWWRGISVSEVTAS